jgi:hypothetical protein
MSSLSLRRFYLWTFRLSFKKEAAMNSKVRTILDGALSGVIGAIVIALWYLIFDAARGLPLNTPSQFASTLFSGFGPSVSTSFWALALGHLFYFFAVFALIGLAAAAIIETADAEKAWFPTMLVFTASFVIFGIMILMLLGPCASASTPWYKVFIGDFMGTTAIMAYLLERHPALVERLEGAWVGVARQGVIAGFLGAFVVAMWFLIVDAAAGQPLLTPALLGAAIFQGVFNPAELQITAPLVIGYTALHFFCFMLFGIATSVLLHAADDEPTFAVLAALLLALFEVIFIGALSIFDHGALMTIGFWSIVVGNFFALVVMLAYFHRRHREWVPRLMQRWESL